MENVFNLCPLSNEIIKNKWNKNKIKGTIQE